ncbi:MAG: serine hydrolase domain-containing protein [Actinomycetota bacterium]
MPGLSDAFERVGAFLEQRLPLTHAAGAALAVTDRDETLGVVVRGFADAASGTPVRPETRFQIGSISKSFAAIVAMQEARGGRLDLHASVNELVPWLELPEPLGRITLHHLMTHSAGLIIGSEEAPSALGALSILRNQRVGFVPGERFWYSNEGWKIVGLILEHLTGTPVHELLRERVLAPLGMTASTAAITNEAQTDCATGYRTLFDDRPPRVSHPLVPAGWLPFNTADGSIVSNVLDMSAYARMLIGGGAPLIDPQGFSILTTGVMADDDWPTFRYAYGLWAGEEDGRRRIWHSGGMLGYTALLMTEPDEGLACVMLLNGQGVRRDAVRFALEAVRAALTGRDLPSVGEAPSMTRVPGAEAFVGEYRGGERSISIEPESDGLVLRERERRARLEVTEDVADSFLVDDPDLDRWPLRFGRDAGGTVVEAFHGDTWFVNDRWHGSAPEPPPNEWSAFPGLYRRANPWGPTLRVALRKGALVAEWNDDLTDVIEQLVPLEDDDGWFHVGVEMWKPQWLRFEDVIDGRASRVTLNGGTWYRSFED